MILDTGLLSPDQPWWILFFAFVIGHAFADYPLQGEFLAKRKNHRLPPDAEGPGQRSGPILIWFHCLTAHALIHAGFVWIVSGVAILAFMEFVLHWIIDYMKSEGWINFHLDQALHLACKLGYVALLYNDIPWVE